MTEAASPVDGTPRYAEVVVEVEPYHLDRPFDYTIPDDLEHPVEVGSRVEVVFAGRRRRGLVVGLADEPAVDPAKLRPLRRVFGPHAWMTLEDIEVARWAAARFGGSVADVVRHALPDRVVEVERRAAAAGWFPPGNADPPSAPPAPGEAALTNAWAPYGDDGSRLLDAVDGGSGAFYWRPLADEDLGARIAELARLCLAGGRDVLLVVPDPASPTADAVVHAGGDLAVDLRGSPGKRRTYDGWLRARCREARLVVGERGAAFWPLGQLGLAVVLDESNPALKERRSPRHHAREVALERARRSGGVGLLIGFVPSAPAWRLLTERRVSPLTPIREEERRRAPQVLADPQDRGVRTRMGHAGLVALRGALERGSYGVVLAARRGEGHALVCATCGWRLACPTCGGSLSADGSILRCHACGWSGPRGRCPECGGRETVPLAAGAQHVAEELQRALTHDVAVLEGYAAPPPPPPAVLVMTRGSVLDAPPGVVGAVVLPDLDGQLRRPTLDAAEDALRLAMHVARWTVTGLDAERDPPPGPAVVAQTREPGHHAVQALVRWDPGGFWRAEADRRRPLRFPPVADVLRLDSSDPGIADELRAALPDGDEVLGPVREDGRWSFLVKAGDRVRSVDALDAVRRDWSRAGRDVRLDVDPVDAL